MTSEAYVLEVAAEHDRIVAEDGTCWHIDSGILSGYSECEAEVWLRHHPKIVQGRATAVDSDPLDPAESLSELSHPTQNRASLHPTHNQEPGAS